MEQAYLDLKEFWVSCWTEKKHNILPSLRKQLTFRDATDSFSAKDVWEKMTRHYTDGFWLVEANFTSGTTNQKHYPNLGSDASSVRNFHVVVTLRIVVCFLRLHPSRTLCKSPLIGVSKWKCLPVFRSLPRRRSASGTGKREEPLRTTSAWEAMSSVQK